MRSLMKNDAGEVLVVKESGRTWWDLPGGGMDRNESIKGAIARELHEEVGFTGNFSYQVIAVEEPASATRKRMADSYSIRCKA